MPETDTDRAEPKRKSQESEELLTSAERERILIEERYRADVRQLLLEDRRAKSRLWTFLNTTFGIWLLSAIFISGAGTVYTQYQNRQAEILKKKEIETLEAIKNRELIQRLDFEIAYRLSQMQIQFAHMSNFRTAERPFRLLPGKSEADVKAVIDTLGELPQGPFRTLYDDFSRYSNIALIAELRRRVPKEEQEEIDRVLSHMSGIYLRLQVDGVKLADVDAVARKIFETLMLKRWRDRRFYFNDCPMC